MTDSYCIRTKRHKDHEDGLPVWWGPNRTGYTTNPGKAGQYSKEEADMLCSDLHGKDYPVKERNMAPHKKKYMDNLRRRARIAFDGATASQVSKIASDFIDGLA